MDELELNIWKKQIIALLLIYLTCMIPVVFTHPKNASMNCYENYSCKVEMTYIWNIKRSATIWINSKTKLRFWGGDMYHSGFVNLYDHGMINEIGNVNLDPFARDDFYVCSYDGVQAQTEAMENDIARFDRYIKKEEPTFEMSKEYDNSRLYIIGGIITLIFTAFALTKIPITNLFITIGYIFRVLFTKRF